MAEAPGTLEGWYALHDFRRLDRGALGAMQADDFNRLIHEAAEFVDSSSSGADGSSGAYEIVGHKSDLLFLHLRSIVDQLAGLERAFAATRLGAITTQTYSYLSVTELSLYEASARGGTEDREKLMQQEFVLRRLKPAIPEMPYVCFYPMNKRRGETVNWYASDFEERRRMMREHGATGKKYHGKVIQMITGSTGLDDWEWGITLFANDPLDIKRLVYEMRFDEVSAKYGDFGPFYFGIRLTPEGLRGFLDSQTRS